jgi:hypothetical protein
MNFWLKHITLLVLLAVLAYLLLDNREVLSSIVKQATEKNSSLISDNNSDAISILPNVSLEKSTNAAADGLSRFYASINPDINTKGPRTRNNVVYLPTPSGNLMNRLEAKKTVTRPYQKSWQGNVKSRPFRTGFTILQKLTEYASSEGIEIIWWLNRDFIIKDPFRIEKNILETSFQLGRSVEGHFKNGLNVFFCYRQRTIVFIDEPIAYLNDECLMLESKSGY